MMGSANAAASSTSGTLMVNIPMLKETMGKPNQLACVIGHELAHITQNHSEDERKERAKYEAIAAKNIAEKVDRIQGQQRSNRGMAMFLGGLSAGLSGDSSSLNSVSNRIALENISAQISAPRIAAQAMKYSPNVAESINKMKGLNSDNLKKAYRHADNYLRNVALAMAGFNRAQEYEADLLGLEYITAAGFNPQGCVKLWTETMPHETDKIIARLLPDGVEDPGKKEQTSIFINKEKDDEDKKSQEDCNKLKGPAKNNCRKKQRRARNDSSRVPEEIMVSLTHPSDKRRAKAIKNHLANKKLINRLKEEGKKARNTKKIRDWNYDKQSETVVISNTLKNPNKVGLEETGSTGIDIDSFLDD